MLSAIKDIGELVNQTVSAVDEKINGQVLFINLDTAASKYAGIDIEDFDLERHKRDYYLCRTGASRGNVSAPFCPITRQKKGETKREGETTYKKIERWLEQCNQSENPLIIKAFEILTQNEEIIISEIDRKIRDLPRKKSEGRFLSLKLDRRYLGEHEVFRKCLAHFNEAKRKRSANTAVCSICGISDKEVSGKTDVFRFYTIDKPGFITGGFQESHAWKNFPVCKNCNTALDAGKRMLQNNRYEFCRGIYYYLIPKLIIGNSSDYNEIIDIIYNSHKRVSLKERITKRITSDDEEILEILAQNRDFLTINFLFTKGALGGSRDAEKIKLLIEDVFPSRIKRIFEAKTYVDRIFNNDSVKRFTFGTIRTFFSKSDEGKRRSDLDKYFLEIVDSVFKGTKLDFSLVVNFYMRKIQRDFIDYDRKGKEKYNFHLSIKEALMTALFFENLGQITFKEVKNMEESIFEDVFKKYGGTFASPVKRGLFLAGALTQMLLNKQAKERGAKPFMKKLKGLKMDERDIKALLPAVQNKFEEYYSFGKGKKLVAEEAYNYLFASGDNWRLSVDEINFYFAGGMNLIRKIKDIIYTKGGKDVDLEEDVQSNEINE